MRFSKDASDSTGHILYHVPDKVLVNFAGRVDLVLKITRGERRSGQ